MKKFINIIVVLFVLILVSLLLIPRFFISNYINESVINNIELVRIIYDETTIELKRSESNEYHNYLESIEIGRKKEQKIYGKEIYFENYDINGDLMFVLNAYYDSRNVVVPIRLYKKKIESPTDGGYIEIYSNKTKEIEIFFENIFTYTN